MFKALRHLGRTYLLTMLGSGAVITALAVVCTHVVTIEFFGFWYAMLPLFFALFTLIYGIYIPPCTGIRPCPSAAAGGISSGPVRPPLSSPPWAAPS